MADMILLGLAIICTAYFMVIVFMQVWEPPLPLSGFSLLLFVYFLYMENGITGKIWTASHSGAGEHCYYLYCRCGHYGSPLYHGVYGSGSQ